MSKVHISYCGGWGYKPQYNLFAKVIKEKQPDLEVTGESSK
jgi:selT/selW/selH-like putative selenoprotein